MKDFVAIDFETANFEQSSICSMGIVIVKNGELVDNFYSLVRPTPNYYNEKCSSVNGMCYDDTCEEREFPEVWADAVKKIYVVSDVLKLIYATLNENGIQIPFPQRDIHIIQ